MQNREHTQNKNFDLRTSAFSNPTTGIFDSPPFVVQSKNDNQVQQPDLKASLIQAEKYGHHLGRFQSTSSQKLEGTNTNETGQTTKAGQQASITQLKKGGKKKVKKSSLTSEARAKTTVANADQPLHPAVASAPNRSTHGHGHTFHGHQTTDAQQEHRVKTGTTPDKKSGKPPSQSSRFTSPQAEAEALGRGRRALDTDLKNGAIPHQGTGFVDPKTGAPVRHSVSVTTNRKTGFGVAAVKQRDSAGKVIKDPKTKQPLTTVDPTPIKTAKLIYEYVPSAKQWRPLTYYPN
ncbi:MULTISPECIES: hypothetical protein [unclassified Nostoc]|uniref:hypothetical protein n=1 Tax=unclassified Nostoc TaxID=2593658 RepID=UPI002623499C|nr:hypothetical protein [Nostoc sp. S13]MDF5734753.1 hypothetical protein [Nostoc sp. S13]